MVHMREEKMKVYPHLKIEKNNTPNRLYAVPLLGFFAKIIMLIPVFIEAVVLGIIFVFLWSINSFVILFTGKYWDTAYDFFLGIMRFYTKISVFMYGLTDTYPGFDLSASKLFLLDIEKPKQPNRLFAIPFFGLLVRFLLLLPYHIFSHVMQNGSWVGMLIGWFWILFYGKFPESIYEFEYDTIRVGLGGICYMTGLSDDYPSFRISMRNQTIKILLIIAGTILTLNSGRNYFFHNEYRKHYQYNNPSYYQYSYPTPTTSTY